MIFVIWKQLCQISQWPHSVNKSPRKDKHWSISYLWLLAKQTDHLPSPLSEVLRIVRIMIVMRRVSYYYASVSGARLVQCFSLFVWTEITQVWSGNNWSSSSHKNFLLTRILGLLLEVRKAKDAAKSFLLMMRWWRVPRVICQPSVFIVSAQSWSHSDAAGKSQLCSL